MLFLLGISIVFWLICSSFLLLLVLVFEFAVLIVLIVFIEFIVLSSLLFDLVLIIVSPLFLTVISSINSIGYFLKFSLIILLTKPYSWYLIKLAR